MINDVRLEQMCNWLSAITIDLPNFKGKLNTLENNLKPASSDASFRRYFRLYCQNTSFIVMDAPPPEEHKNCQPFAQIATLLAKAGLNVPQILAADFEQGFLLLSDLGTQTWLEILTLENADELFSLAIDALILLQKTPLTENLPHYTQALLQRDLSLFADWYLDRHCSIQLNETQQRLWQQICEQLIESALKQPTVLVHRDYMPRNLMLSTPNPGVLDFQDAVYGPVSYDITCLFKDAFISWPQTKVEQWLKLYYQQAKTQGIAIQPSFEEFHLASDLMGVQRHLKVIGIFCRIKHRDGKPHYAEDIPRFLAYIDEVLSRRPQLNLLKEFLEQLPLTERQP